MENKKLIMNETVPNTKFRKKMKIYLNCMYKNVPGIETIDIEQMPSTNIIIFNLQCILHRN